MGRGKHFITPELLAHRAKVRLRNRAYSRWLAMKSRCEDSKDPKYARYGGRGIAVCDRWGDFDAFYADVGDPPEGKFSMDRIDTNGHYEPGNVRWATAKEQRANQTFGGGRKAGTPNRVPRRDQSVRVFDGEREITLLEAAERLGCKRATLTARLKLKKRYMMTDSFQIEQLIVSRARYPVITSTR